MGYPVDWKSAVETSRSRSGVSPMTAFLGIVVLFIGGVLSTSALAQETIFNVPSVDVLERGKVYGEFDFAYLGETNAGGYTPRMVAGIGHQIEVGLNLNGISTPGPSQTT